jgi:hypothetical protein
MAQTISAVTNYGAEASPARVLPNKTMYREDEVVANYFKVLKWCFIPIICFTAVWLFEIYILESARRFVPNPAEMASRIFGFSHYLVGLMFMMSSRKMRKLKGWLWFIGLLSVSVVISVFFYNFGGKANPVMVIFYFLFFMVHGYRDMVFFYKPSSDDPALERTRSRILVLIQACLLLALMYVLVPAYLFYRSLKPKAYSPELKSQIEALMPYLKVILGLSWLLLPILLLRLRRLLRRYPGGLPAFRAENKPILRVLLYSSLIILASPLLGPWVFSLLILSHFVGWYFYASRQLSTIPKQSGPGDGLWKWVRGSVAGFQWLHLGAAAVFFVVVFVNYFFLGDRGVVNTMFNANAFYYWTVIHVTISFAPRN